MLFGHQAHSHVNAALFAGLVQTSISSKAGALFIVTEERLPDCAAANSSVLQELQRTEGSTGPIQFTKAQLQIWCQSSTGAPRGMGWLVRSWKRVMECIEVSLAAIRPFVRS
jgi:hypothetical protein